MAREPTPSKPTTQQVRTLLTTSTSNIASTASNTAARHRAPTLSHLGPWPLKRSLSEHDCGYASTDALMAGGESHTAQTHPNLAEVLARIDEECRAVDLALQIEAAYRGRLEESYERTLREEELQLGENTAAALTTLLAAAAIIVFVSVPVMAFVFAHAALGGVVLHEEAASKVAFGVLLAVFAMTGGVLLVGTVAGPVAVNKGRAALMGKSVATTVAYGIMIGGAVTAWVLPCVLPLISHA